MERMETLKEFQNRTGGFTTDSLPAAGESFVTNPGLSRKVGEDGRLLNFYGDTTVFLLDEESRAYVQQIREILYENCSGMFAEPLRTESFHVTLHDLCSGTSEQEVQSRTLKNRSAAEQILKKIKEDPTKEVEMKTTYVFNMVNTSAVLGLEPVDEENCRKLMEWYDMLQTVVPLSYPLTPHITLGYYRPGYYGPEILKKLRDTFEKANSRQGKQISLQTQNLVYQYFSNMNCFGAQAGDVCM